jgi:hypothetical protein
VQCDDNGDVFNFDLTKADTQIKNNNFYLPLFIMKLYPAIAITDSKPYNHKQIQNQILYGKVTATVA